MPAETLAQKIRAKFPGVYDQLDDRTLEQKVTEKYPGVYDAVPRTPPASWGETAGDVVTGFGKGAARTALMLGGVVHQIPGVSAAVDAMAGTPGLSQNAFEVGNREMASRNTAQTVGGYGETAAELALLGGPRALTAMREAPSLAGKAVAAVKSVATTQLGPIAKYEIVKAALKHIGLSEGAATAIATGVVMRSGGGEKAAGPATVAQTAEAAAVPAAEAAAVEAPVVAARAAPPPVGVTPAPSPIAAPRVPPVGPVAPPVGPVAPPAAPMASPVVPQNPLAPITAPVTPTAGPRIVMSPQRMQNELGLAARRANLKLTEPQFAEAETLMRAGKTPVEAVTTVASGPAAAAPTVVTAAGETAGKLKLNRDELNEYVRMTKSGIAPADAVMAIAKQRALQQALGTPTTSEVIRRVVDRNTTGRWQP
jgi:hypothetical protein